MMIAIKAAVGCLLSVVFALTLFVSGGGNPPENIEESPPLLLRLPSPSPDPSAGLLVSRPFRSSRADAVDLSAEPGPARESAASLLTGEYIGEAPAAQRPIAVVINNIRAALPQSGIGQAGLYYEVLAEGDITRIIAVFQGAESAKIGPIRSARDYFIRFALDNNAIFAHHGGSDAAYAHISSLKIDNIDGMRYDGTLYWRDPVRASQKGMYEHSSYSSAANLLEAAKRNGYETELAEGAKFMLSFYPRPIRPENAGSANLVRIPFSNAQNACFEYNEATGLYARCQYGAAQIDEENGEQLTVKNVIIQSAEMYVISGDSYGRRSVTLVGSGNGWLATEGVYEPVKWSKESDFAPTRWFNAEGDELFINKGKTWICVLESEKAPEFE